MRLGDLRVVLFDLDGTLIETAPEIADAVNDTLRELALPAAAEDEVARWIGHGTGELLIHALARAGGRSTAQVRADPALAAASQVFDRHYARRCGTRSRLYRGARGVLDALRAQGTALAIVTNKEGRYTERVLAAHGLSETFDAVISGDTLPAKKPDPAGVRHVLASAQALPAQALFVGDSSIDAATARAAGVDVWLLAHGYNMGQPLSDSAPDRLLSGFDELAAALRLPHPQGATP